MRFADKFSNNRFQRGVYKGGIPIHVECVEHSAANCVRCLHSHQPSCFIKPKGIEQGDLLHLARSWSGCGTKDGIYLKHRGSWLC